MCPRGLDGMHIRKCNETAGERRGGGGGAGFAIRERLEGDWSREVKLPRSSEKGVSRASASESNFAFVSRWHCSIPSLHFCLLVISNEAVTWEALRKKETRSSFLRGFETHQRQWASIVFVIAVIIIISIRSSSLEEFRSTTRSSSEFCKNKIVCRRILQSKAYVEPFYGMSLIIL